MSTNSNIINTSVATNGQIYNNIVTTTGNWTINSNNLIYGSPGFVNDLEYRLDKYRFKMNRYLTYDEVNFITTIGILGTDYYDTMVDNHVIISTDLSEKIEPIIKLMKRKDIIDSISKKEKNE